jgi:hypothetical protein
VEYEYGWCVRGARERGEESERGGGRGSRGEVLFALCIGQCYLLQSKFLPLGSNEKVPPRALGGGHSRLLFQK